MGFCAISFNAIGIPDTDVVGVPLVELHIKQFSLPITGYITSFFLTARLAARRMVANKSGVIMTVSALPARTGTRLNGGYGAANAAGTSHSLAGRRLAERRALRHRFVAIR